MSKGDWDDLLSSVKAVAGIIVRVFKRAVILPSNRTSALTAVIPLISSAEPFIVLDRASIWTLFYVGKNSSRVCLCL